MTFAVHVAGGSGAGRKRPLRPPPKPWKCVCGETHPGYQTRCWVSDMKRPAKDETQR